VIHIHLEANSVGELHEQMLAMLAGHSTVAAPAAATTTTTTTTETKPKSRSKKAEEVPQPPTAPSAPGNAGASGGTTAGSDEGSRTENGTATGSTGPTATTDASPSDVSGEDFSKEAIKARAAQLNMKAGPQALSELLTSFGATLNAQGQPSFASISEDKYPAMAARLTELGV
jgi:hypothetical protein